MKVALGVDAAAIVLGALVMLTDLPLSQAVHQGTLGEALHLGLLATAGGAAYAGTLAIALRLSGIDLLGMLPRRSRPSGVAQQAS